MAVRACQAWKADAEIRVPDTGFQTWKIILGCGSNKGSLISDPESPMLESWLCHFPECHPVLFSFPSLQLNDHLLRHTSVLATTGWVRPNPSLDKFCRSGAHDHWGHLKGKYRGCGSSAEADVNSNLASQNLSFLEPYVLSSNTLCPTSSLIC